MWKKPRLKKKGIRIHIARCWRICAPNNEMWGGRTGFVGLFGIEICTVFPFPLRFLLPIILNDINGSWFLAPPTFIICCIALVESHECVLSGQSLRI